MERDRLSGKQGSTKSGMWSDDQRIRYTGRER